MNWGRLRSPPFSYWEIKMAYTKKTTSKTKATKSAPAPKQTTVKMYCQEKDLHADVHPLEVENYRKGGFQEVK